MNYKLVEVDSNNLDMLRQIRNSCRSYMTRNTDHIDIDSQKKWFESLDKNKIPYLFNDGEKDIGYAYILKTDDISLISGGLLPSMRNMGIGYLLFKSIIEKCNTSIVDLEVLKSNVRAFNTYIKLGFEQYSFDDRIIRMRYKK